ncbi:MAG: hypothetical protein HY926_07460 [Elusimicrobia bacterium]|nr:hypothetical protein [Elusimicrobiota bacterium]
MFRKLATAAAALMLATLAVYGAHLWVQSERRMAGDRALLMTASWPEGAALAARLMVEQYGPPQWASAGQLEWASAAPWKRIVVRGRGMGFLEQAIVYRLPQDRLGELWSFGRGLRPDLERGELAVTGESEEYNLLCLNLANDIALGRMNAEQARKVHDDIVRKSYAGKSSPYLERLLFGTALPDEGVLPMP